MAGYQLKITLEYTKPPVWRRVIVPDGITFGALHEIIQKIFGWENMHLHDFSFPADLFPHIGPVDDMGDPFSDDLDEQEVYLDEYLEDNPWIRYTYDFGDDWMHKIVLEKTLPDYEERYPQVIKYKGANFLEDSGGIWGMEEGESNREPFLMEEINTWMKANFFFDPVKQTEEILNEILDMGREVNPSKRPQEFMEGLRGIVEQRKDGLDEDALEMLDETMDEIQMLLGMISGGAGMGGRRSAMDTKLEQIEWYYPQEGEYSPIGIKAEIIKGAPKRGWSEVLLDLQKEQLQKFCEILRLRYLKSWNKKKLTSEIASKLAEHPEFLYYFLTKEGLKSVLSFAKAPEGHYYGNLRADALKTLLWWGYIDAEFRLGVEPEILLSIPEEPAALLSKLSKGNWKRESGNMEKATEEIGRLLQYYGYIEINELYKIYNRIIHPMEKESFYNYIYLAASEQELMWYLGQEQADFLCLEDLKQEAIARCREENVQELGYCDITLLDVERWKKGLGAVYPEWKELIQYLYNQDLLSWEEIDEFIEFELYPFVMEGAGIKDLTDAAREFIQPQGIEEAFQLWEYLQKIFLCTRIAGLKGYTREELAEKKKENPFAIAASKEKRNSRKVKDAAHMHETPLTYQREISRIIKERKNSLNAAAQKMEGLLKKYNENHYEGRYLLAMICYEGGQKEKACHVLESLVKDIDDQGLKKLLEEWKTKE